MSEFNKTKTIRVSDDTIKMLGKEREGFETPDQCLQRILSGRSCKKGENNDDIGGREHYYDKYGNHYSCDKDKKNLAVHLDPNIYTIEE